MNVLALNSGSSSLKFGIYETRADAVSLVFGGEADWRDGAGQLVATDAGGQVIAQTEIAGRQDALSSVSPLIEARGIQLAAAGHRIVHGGPALRQHCLIGDDVLVQLAAAAEFAPLHVPPALELIHATMEHFHGLPQVACFDTAFHAGLPDVARLFALPRELIADGVERFGFHGLSCESILRRLENVPDRLVIAHLGNGASITAVRGGRSVDTSMGLTPTGGVIMGTRTGDLDPGVLTFLMRRHGYGPQQLEDVIDHRSGLLGISGLSSDMRSLHAAAGTNPAAALAIEMFCYSVRKQIAAMAAALGGIDLLVFTGGIGEHDEAARDAICEGLTFLNIPQIRVLPSLEDEQIALHTARLAPPCHPRPSA